MNKQVFTQNKYANTQDNFTKSELSNNNKY